MTIRLISQWMLTKEGEVDRTVKLVHDARYKKSLVVECSWLQKEQMHSFSEKDKAYYHVNQIRRTMTTLGYSWEQVHG